MSKKQILAAKVQPYSAITEVTSPNTTLAQLCSEGKLNDLKQRVEQGADIEVMDSDGNSLTHTAAQNDKLDVLKWLLDEKKIDVNKVNNANRTVLQVALAAGHQSTIEWLIENRNSLKLPVTIDDLCDAVLTKNITVVKSVARAIEVVYQRNRLGKTAADLARQNNYSKIENFLAKKMLFDILREEVPEYMKLQKLKEHLDNQKPKIYNESIAQTHEENITLTQASQYPKMYAVILAAKKQHMGIVKWLVEKGANANIALDSGSTLLAEIKWSQNPENFKWLVDKGANIYSQDDSGKFALEKYVDEENVEMIKWAVEEKNVDVFTDNKNGVSLIALAVQLGKEKIIDYLIKSAVVRQRINEKLTDNKTLLHLAVAYGHESIVKKLVVADAHININDRNNNTPIDIAIANKFDSIAEILVISLTMKILLAKDVKEETKLENLKKMLAKYGYHYLQKKAGSFKEIIDEAKKLKLDKVVQWLKANETASSIDGSVTSMTTKRKEYNVLLIGETGVGKSTFVNAFINYINFNSLDEAVKAKDLYCLVPSNFAITDENYERHVVTCGNQHENETFEAGQSSTQNVKSYSIVTDNTILRLIDTPGIGDTRGIERDRENFDKLLKVIAELENIHAICVMLKPNNSRLTVLFEYCIRELFAHLDKSASRNIVFLFTNSRGTFYRPGDTLPPLLRILQELKSPPTNITINFNKDNVFCMDNEAFRFLLAKKTKNVTFSADEVADFATSWNKSAEVCRSMIKYLIKLEPHKIQNSATINAAKRIVFSLSKPLAEVAEHIDRTASHLRAKKELIESNRENIDVLKKNLHLKVPVLKIERLSMPITACLNRSCVSSYEISGVWHDVARPCHDPCFHTYIVSNIKGHGSLWSCSIMSVGKCIVCFHSIRDHIRLYYKKTIKEEELINVNLNLELRESTINQATIEKFKRQLEDRNKQFKDEEEAILRAMSKFSHFLKHNSLISFNDVCKDYIQDLIDGEKKLGDQANRSLLSTYQNILLKYEQHFNELENEFKRTRRVVVGPSDVFKEIDNLYKLEYFGKTIKELSHLQMELQKSDILPDTKVEPRNNTFATFINSLE
ncbi:Ankyrin repeat-containing protein [Oryctes borbonicus]|uniref:Ankyrin repeat-containing protein n=1 Tax=Oryctes borbonicus TaxID=1629725 RepID=A0A0T6ATV2_9SCAR|nr:Ankyrin repeat-containing protein [Oryctes borbonicus]